MAIDRGFCQEARAGLRSLVDAIFPPGCIPLTQVANLQRGLASHSTDRQVSGDQIVMIADGLYLAALESDVGMMIYIQKVRAAQVGVTVRLSGPKSAGLYGCLYVSVTRICRIEFKRAMHVFEMSPYMSHHHMPRTKLSRGMSGFKKPFLHDRASFGVLRRLVTRAPIFVSDLDQVHTFHGNLSVRKITLQKD